MSSTPKSLIDLIKERALLRGQPQRLASGLVSDIYVDCKRLTLHGPSLKLVSKAFVDFLALQTPKPASVAGVSVGGDPIVAGVLLEAHDRGQSWSGLLIRKEPKKHGASQGRSVEGPPPNEIRQLWLLEDVVSTGMSSLNAAQSLKQEAYSLAGVLCLVDREMGGVEKLQTELSVPVFGLVKLSELS